MEKGTRDVQCQYCLPERTIIRIKVTVDMYGKKARITCEKCTTTFLVPIPIPAAAPEQAPTDGFPFSDTFDEIFGDLFKPKK